MFDRRRARSLASAHVLMASPLRGDLGEQVAATTHELPPMLRRASAELLIALGDHRAAAHARRWVESEDPALLGPGLVALAHVGERVAQPRLAELLERPDPVSRRALYHAGMTGHPEAARLAADAAHPLNATARWWLRHGPAVTS
jgi:HEAT repeat protein